VIPPLGGVTITLSSEQIGTVTMVTDEDGTYRYAMANLLNFMSYDTIVMVRY